MPITIDDNDFPASYDTTLNLLQIVRSQAHLIKKITGKSSWLDYPDNNIQKILTQLESDGSQIDALIASNATNATNISNNTAAINSINSISRPRILWKPARAQNFTVGTTASTIYTITIPAGTCSVDSILNLHINVFGSNTTNTKTFLVTCNGTTITNFNLGQNTTYPYKKRIAFNGALNSPYCTAIGDGGYSTSAGSYLSAFADFSQSQTILIRGSASIANESIFINGAYLELI
ncbi:hypothetical protein NIES21_27230 [Anabaenopsis circularis NIES-21]|uniref:Uncharacterized protein n=1 Tax=Anabaenopsis circularis NIES-21 TaxID=1085406 RepID=A0A1Z4GHC8_9CYAN|nr:hypothetical protein NIES21_27230 [Anabaenopsis circularis NIES-21]